MPYLQEAGEEHGLRSSLSAANAVALIDLGKWASGGYVISSPVTGQRRVEFPETNKLQRISTNTINTVVPVVP